MDSTSQLQKLLSTPVKELDPVGQKVIIVEKGSPLTQAFHLLVKNNIYSAPVWNRTTGGYEGFLDLLDIICFFVALVEEKDRPVKKRKIIDFSDYKQLDFNSLFSKMEKMDSEFAGHIVDYSHTNPFCMVNEEDTIADVLEIFASSGTHRIAVLDGLSAFPKIGFILTQSELISWLNQRLDQLGEGLTKKTVQELGLAQKVVITVNHEMLAIEAFRLMAKHKITGVAVVDDDGIVVANLSAKDIKVTGGESMISTFYQTVLEFVSKSHQHDANISVPVFYSKPSNTFGEAIHRLALLKIHRLYVVDENKRPNGVISLTDIVRIINRYAKQFLMK